MKKWNENKIKWKKKREQIYRNNKNMFFPLFIYFILFSFSIVCLCCCCCWWKTCLSIFFPHIRTHLYFIVLIFSFFPSFSLLHIFGSRSLSFFLSLVIYKFFLCDVFLSLTPRYFFSIVHGRSTIICTLFHNWTFVASTHACRTRTDNIRCCSHLIYFCSILYESLLIK